MTQYKDDPFPNLIISYDRAADLRDQFNVSDWKKDLRSRYLNILKKEDKSKLIDIGAGTGIHAKYFQDQGIDVTCVDLSPALIDKCVQKGLRSYETNILDMSNFGQVFDAAFALNSLLHIPTTLLPDALSNISRILEPDGLLFWGQYGGEYREGVYQSDNYDPKRFFSLIDDNQMREFASINFTIENFDLIKLEDLSSLHFQSMLLRVKSKPKR
jgi:SAM-dependent methyltransferase